MKEYLENQLRNVIHNTCNTIGCYKCPDKWDGGCAATDLQNKLFDLEDKNKEQK